MKLLICIHSLNSGGAERVSVNLANHWAAKGWQITIVTLSPQSNDFYALNPAVMRIALALDGDSRNSLVGMVQNLRRVLAIRRVLRQIQPGIALGMMTTANVLLALAAIGLTRIRTVGSERTHPPQHPLGAVWEWLRSYSYARLDAVVAQTNESAAWLKAHTRAQRVLVIPNPVGWPLASHLPQLAVKNVCRTGRSLLLAVGRLSNEKQFGLLLDCFGSLASRHPDWDLVILGEGPLRSALELQIKESGLEKRIFLPGKAGNVGDWYQHADLFVLSSRFEGFPNTLVEAMAYGLPAVSFDCDTGPRDIIRHQVDGLLVSPMNANSLTAALDQLLGDGDLRQRFAVRAVEVRERFAIEGVASQWERLFEVVRND